jgi:hypothetical protein
MRAPLARGVEGELWAGVSNGYWLLTTRRAANLAGSMAK